MNDLNPMPPVPEPDADFERRMWERIRPQVQRSIEQRKQRRLMVMAGGCAALALLAVLLPLQRPKSAASRVPESGESRVLRAKLSDHLERSQILLTEIEHVTEGNAGSAKERARNLLDDNRLLKEASLRGKEFGRVAVLDALEPTLLTIANAPERMTKTDVDSLQERLKENSLLFKVRVARNQLELSHSQKEIQRPL